MDFLLQFFIEAFSMINFQDHLFRMKSMILITKDYNWYCFHYMKMPVSIIQFYHITILFYPISF